MATSDAIQRKVPEPNLRRRETLNKILCWVADTEVEYKPEGKRPGTASFERYKNYSKATKVSEALAWGSMPEDLVNDLTKGILKVTGGPLREKPLELEEVISGKDVTDTDRALGKFLKGFHRYEMASKLGLDTKSVGEKRSWCESPVTHGQRVQAEKSAQLLLKEVDESGAKVTDAHVLEVLRKWGFRRNTTRKNVAPDDRPVCSDMFGVMRNQASVWIITKATLDYPSVTKLLTRWLQDTLPTQDFAFSSIHVNSGFACKRHRERDILGPTVMRALGDYTEGGQLWYWPEDDGLGVIDQMPEEAKVTLDMHSAPAIIDGLRSHEEEPFTGERFSVSFYCMANTGKMPAELQGQLKEAGFSLPDEEMAEAAKHFFPAPKGYGLEPAPRVVPKRTAQDAEKSDKDRRKRARKIANKRKRAADFLLAKLKENAKPAEEPGAEEGAAEDKPKTKGKAAKTGFKQGTLMKQAALKLKSKDETKLKLSGLKIKTKASNASGLLAQMLSKQDGGEEEQTEENDKDPEASSKPTAKSSGSSGGPNNKSPATVGKVVSGLLDRVIAKKSKDGDKAQDEEEGSNTPQRKRSNSSGTAGSGTSGPLSSKKHKAPTTAAKSAEDSSKASANAPAAATTAVPEAVKAASEALGVGLDDREAVECQHFLPLASLMRMLEENPAAAVGTLTNYFLMLLHMGDTPESLLRTALDLLIPNSPVPQEAMEGAIVGAFGSSMTQVIQEKGLAEAAQEGRRCKRSLRAPPPRLTLVELLEAAVDCRSSDEAKAAVGRSSLVSALGAARVDSKEAYYVVKILRGAAGVSMGEVHAAVARAMVTTAKQ